MKRILVSLIVVAVIALGIVGCDNSNKDTDSSKISVIATLFPQYDFAKKVGGDKVDVTLLLPPGAESHTYEPTPGDIVKINKSDFFIYTGEVMEPWAHRIIEGSAGKTQVIDASSGIEMIDDDHNHEEEATVDHDHEYDPHIWLDLTQAVKMVDTIADGFSKKDPENEAYYRKNAQTYKSELENLDEEFKAAIDEGKRDTVVFGGKFAYQYFLNHYHLNYETAYESCSTEGEPSVKKISEIIKYVKDNDIKVIFHEEFVDPKIAKSIAAETNAKLLLFTTAHNVTKDEYEQGVTFVDLMRDNLENLKEGLR